MAIDPIKDPLEDDPFGDEKPKKLGFNLTKKNLWIIVGVVVLVVVAVIFSVQNNPPSGGSNAQVTLAGVHADVEVIKEWKATQMEATANLNSAVGDLKSDFDDLDIPPDRLNTINAINDKVLALEDKVEELELQSSNISTLETTLVGINVLMAGIQADIVSLGDGYEFLEIYLSEIDLAITELGANLAAFQSQTEARLDDLESRSQYATAISINGSLLQVDVVGVGDYPVVVTLYDFSKTLSAGVVSEVETGYTISAEHLYGASSILAIFVEPSSSWTATDEFTLDLGSLSVDYATASVGAK